MKDHKCKTFLVSSPSPACNKTSSLHGGITGGSLTFKAFYVKRYGGGTTTGL
ncbi:hypothetical protein QJS10_CPB20g01768 [Acorus calamus]|uniref:Uncharacterized protein n=1 Tax=Acorus calamus TaxID=4465 RepID=A0AAV9C7U6_ACOCL|nr:hypothetical protein QJS10_CPB20g01768 [Acorus calamus]